MAKRKKLPHTVLAEGEATGHKHQVFGEGVALYDDGREGVLVLEVPEEAEASVKHEEHHAQTITPGLKDRLIVREWDHFKEEARNVAD